MAKATMPRTIGLFRRRIAVVAAALAIVATVAGAQGVRIKDICSIEGVRSNQLIGYGLVVGLDGTGDGDDADFTRQSLVSFLRRHNIRVDVDNIKVENVAAVMVTANLPPFTRPGARIDAVVSSIGDAEDLHGGTLVATPLRPVTADASTPNSIYAVVQGPISTGGFSAGTGGSKVMKNHPTVAVISNGALVERSVPTLFATKPETHLMLKNPDFTTAQRIATIINNTMGAELARARDSASVAVRLPGGGTEQRVQFISEIEALQVSPDSPARVVYNERTGTIVMGSNVRISTAIITHGNLIFEKQNDTTNLLTKTITPEGTVDQTQIQQTESSVDVTEERGQFKVLDEGVTIGEVARGLNALGVTARDIIAILQALKECGALQAELVPM